MHVCVGVCIVYTCVRAYNLYSLVPSSFNATDPTIGGQPLGHPNKVIIIIIIIIIIIKPENECLTYNQDLCDLQLSVTCN